MQIATDFLRCPSFIEARRVLDQREFVVQSRQLRMHRGTSSYHKPRTRHTCNGVQDRRRDTMQFKELPRGAPWDVPAVWTFFELDNWRGSQPFDCKLQAQRLALLTFAAWSDVSSTVCISNMAPSKDHAASVSCYFNSSCTTTATTDLEIPPSNIFGNKHRHTNKTQNKEPDAETDKLHNAASVWVLISTSQLVP